MLEAEWTVAAEDVTIFYIIDLLFETEQWLMPVNSFTLIAKQNLPYLGVQLSSWNHSLLN